MRMYEEIRNELAARIAEEAYDAVNGLRADLVAHWILQNYTPPFEWEEIPPDPRAQGHQRFAWTIKCRTLIAGEFRQSVSFETLEQHSRQPEEVKKRHRDHIRSALGRAIAHIIDPSAGE
jgi:hypothetical protein